MFRAGSACTNRGQVDQDLTQLQIVEQIAVFPKIPKIQTVHSTQTSESLDNSLIRQAAKAAEMVEVETPIPAESQTPQVVVDCVQSAPVVDPEAEEEEEEEGGREEHSPGARDPRRDQMQS